MVFFNSLVHRLSLLIKIIFLFLYFIFRFSLISISCLYLVFLFLYLLYVEGLLGPYHYKGTNCH